MITVQLGGRLGNQMWQYAVCRTVAELKGYDFYIDREFYGRNIFDCSLGVEQDLTHKYFTADNSDHDQSFNPDIYNIDDYTKIIGHLQTEKYIINNKKNIQQWFKLKTPNIDLYKQLNLGNNTCIINFRGKDYKPMNEVYLPVKYYFDSIQHIKNISLNINFIVITDDVEEAQKIFPDYPVYHFNIQDDFYIVNQSQYTIIANSTFSWWASWLNLNNKFTIAPKYWFRHNVSNNYWSTIDSITTGFFYVDRDGSLFSSNKCLSEL